MMDEYLPLSHFKAVYIVDLCHSLCEQVGAQDCFTFQHRCVEAVSLWGVSTTEPVTTGAGPCAERCRAKGYRPCQQL
jgi:hypothetical protein